MGRLRRRVRDQSGQAPSGKWAPPIVVTATASDWARLTEALALTSAQLEDLGRRFEARLDDFSSRLGELRELDEARRLELAYLTASWHSQQVLLTEQAAEIDRLRTLIEASTTAMAGLEQSLSSLGDQHSAGVARLDELAGATESRVGAHQLRLDEIERRLAAVHADTAGGRLGPYRRARRRPRSTCRGDRPSDGGCRRRVVPIAGWPGRTRCRDPRLSMQCRPSASAASTRPSPPIGRRPRRSIGGSA